MQLSGEGKNKMVFSAEVVRLLGNNYSKAILFQGFNVRIKLVCVMQLSGDDNNTGVFSAEVLRPRMENNDSKTILFQGASECHTGCELQNAERKDQLHVHTGVKHFHGGVTFQEHQNARIGAGSPLCQLMCARHGTIFRWQPTKRASQIIDNRSFRRRR
jgi:hypothetical protein